MTVPDGLLRRDEPIQYSHLGNIAVCTESALWCDPKNGHILKNKEAANYWGPKFRKGWEPKV